MLLLSKYKMLEYSEYKDLVDILQSSNQESTYQDVMSKETKVLDTLNSVIKNYRDDTVNTRQFINTPFALIVNRFFNMWIDIFTELSNIKYDKSISIKNYFNIFIKDDRLIYMGIMLIIISFIIYYIDITNS